ncbi:MAG TPA: DUF2490 domain-containing protein [Terriglobales bacterium]|nr:DUF2490 domain-containing protein [Terriglobales bacterium]
MPKSSIRFVLFAATLALCLPAAAQKHDDTQLWPEVQVTWALPHHWSLMGAAGYRADDNLSHLFQRYINAGGGYAPSRYLNLAGFYRLDSQRPAQGHHTLEKRWTLDAIPHLPIGRKWGLSDRNRIEWRWLNGALSERFRNMPRVEREFSLDGHKLTPYLAGEFFYDTRFHLWNRSRFYAGNQFGVNRHFTLDTYYMRQFDARSLPRHINVVYTGVKLRF